MGLFQCYNRLFICSIAEPSSAEELALVFEEEGDLHVLASDRIIHGQIVGISFIRGVNSMLPDIHGVADRTVGESNRLALAHSTAVCPITSLV